MGFQVDTCQGKGPAEQQQHRANKRNASLLNPALEDTAKSNRSRWLGTATWTPERNEVASEAARAYRTPLARVANSVTTVWR